MNKQVPQEPQLQLVRALSSLKAYPHAPPSVEVNETHASWLFFTGQFVYKVKKPVNYGFLDFTTLEKRKTYCYKEVQLNRRISPDVYLGVVEICLSNGKYVVEGPGQIVEYAVKMLQLPRERVLQRLIQEHKVSVEDVKRIARKIATFHKLAATSAEITRLGGYQPLCQNIRENFFQTSPYIGRTISRPQYTDLKAYSEAFLERTRDAFLKRESDGWVRDCHGDLHTAQIFLTNGIHIIDCIEFNERFRYSDVGLDIAFLAMDLDYHSRPDLSRTLIDEYTRELGDNDLYSFLDFYKAYRAYVRGKVISFTQDSPTLSPDEKTKAQKTARSYFDLAQSYIRPLKTHTLFVFTGLMGTGKTTVAQKLSQIWGAQLVSSDIIRKELAGFPADEKRYVPFGTGIYSPEFTNLTYTHMLQIAKSLLESGSSVILDASFSKAEHRRLALNLATQSGVPALFIHCVAAKEYVMKRLKTREELITATSDGRRELYDRQAQAYEPLNEAPPEVLITVDTSKGLEDSVFELVKAIYIRRVKQNS
jgi:aminoglycoside phosphotransferase family enzyme/predicted kinase